MGTVMEQFEHSIAIIGMSGRFPGAGDDLNQFWQNLQNGVESVRRFSHQELQTMGIDAHLRDNPRFVAADAILADIDQFDAQFFDFSPREAQILDPQHRLFLESCWSALEVAGYVPEQIDGRVGVYAGSALSAYMFRNLKSNPGLIESVGTFKTMLANDKDFLATRVSYKLGFTGASLNVNTLCSSSAAAIALACDSLISYQNDMVLAGGVSLQLTRNETFFYQEGNIGSADGYCRAFDDRASGTVSGSGLGVVVLKRYSDAVADGDNILAIIRGWAVNNDGADKASYTAPSVDGQAAVITEALAMAGVSADAISYVEAHGTGTQLGDPIEIAALTKAYRQSTDAKQYCAIGSVKTNIGHLVTAGGVASLIKTVLALQHRKIPQNLNYSTPNSKIDFANSPFFVADRCLDWQVNAGTPRIAGLSSFGIGGTNVHLILQEAPHQQREAGVSALSTLAFPLSAKSANSLEMAASQLADFVEGVTDRQLPGIAATLQMARSNFEYRQVLLADNTAELVAKLRGTEVNEVWFAQAKTNIAEPVLMFSGQGSQYAGTLAGLYGKLPAFTAAVDACLAVALPLTGETLRELLFVENAELDEQCQQTRYAQPILFISEYAMAQQLLSLGVRPVAFIGHSLGEYVAACVAGVFSLSDALTLVIARASLMQQVPAGGMLSVAAEATLIRALLPAELTLAAQNAPKLCVVSGPHEALRLFATQLEVLQIQHHMLQTEKAFHSAMMEPILAEYARCCQQISYHPPKIPLISNLTGQPIAAIDADYWVRQLRSSVLFADGIQYLLSSFAPVLIEVGPGQALASMARQQAGPGIQVLTSYPQAKQRHASERCYLQMLAKLWLNGIIPKWQTLYHQVPQRLVLPTYAFERQSYWIDELPASEAGKSLGTVNIDLSAEAWPDDLQGAKVEVQLEFGTGLSKSQQQQLTGALQQLTMQWCEVLERQFSAAGQLQVQTRGYKAPAQLAVSALPSVDMRQYVKSAYVAPRNELEQLLVEKWQKTLGVAPVGVHDNFFELGGHSLLAAALANEMVAHFDVVIPLVELLEYPTVAGLAQLITELQQSATGAERGQAHDLEEERI
jgi:phthiocerol/phenolphthiocerol synthesis type-I polyketide synthase E